MTQIVIVENFDLCLLRSRRPQAERRLSVPPLVLTLVFLRRACKSPVVDSYLLSVLAASFGFVAFYEFAIPSDCYGVAIYESAEEKRATLVIQYAHPRGPRLMGVHVLMKK